MYTTYFCKHLSTLNEELGALVICLFSYGMTRRGEYNQLFPRPRCDCSGCDLPALVFCRRCGLLSPQSVVPRQVVCVSFCQDKGRPRGNQGPLGSAAASLPALPPSTLPHWLSPSYGPSFFPTPVPLHSIFLLPGTLYPLFLRKPLLLVAKLKVTSSEKTQLSIMQLASLFYSKDRLFGL